MYVRLEAIIVYGIDGFDIKLAPVHTCSCILRAMTDMLASIPIYSTVKHPIASCVCSSETGSQEPEGSAKSCSLYINVPALGHLLLIPLALDPSLIIRKWTRRNLPSSL